MDVSGLASPSGPTDPEAGQKEPESESQKVLNFIGPAAIEARTLSLPHYGVTSEPRLFGLWSTFPWHLRKHSAFLALHSGSIGLFVLLLVGHCGLSVWPLANTLKANNYRREYTVIDPTNARTCESQEKPYQAGNFALRMSLGNFCYSKTFSSPLDCCTQCIADIPADDAANVCSLLPCPNSFTWNSEEQYTGSCCVLNQEINSEDAGDEPESIARYREHKFGDVTRDTEDPQIFTDCIKPHFEYFSPPLDRFDRQTASSGRVSLPKIGPQRYAYVEPATAFNDAFNMAVTLPGKAVRAAGKTVGVAGKAVGAAGMAVLNFGRTHPGPSSQDSDLGNL